MAPGAISNDFGVRLGNFEGGSLDLNPGRSSSLACVLVAGKPPLDCRPATSQAYSTSRRWRPRDPAFKVSAATGAGSDVMYRPTVSRGAGSRQGWLLATAVGLGANAGSPAGREARGQPGTS